MAAAVAPSSSAAAAGAVGGSCPPDTSLDAQVEGLRQWLDKQHHLPPVSDEELRMFVHCSYGSSERAKKLLDVYFTVRTHATELFSNRDPRQPDIQRVWDKVQLCVLPERDPEGNKILLGNIKDSCAQEFDLDAAIKASLLGLDAVVSDDRAVPGYVVLFDMRGLHVGHLKTLNIATIRHFFLYVQEGFPIRLKAIHVLNTNSLIESIMMIINPFLNKQLKDILHFHSGSLEEFYKVVDKDLLPEDYGGKQRAVPELFQELLSTINKSSESLADVEKKKVDESKRPKTAAWNANGVFGMEGSFRKLEID